MSNLMEQRYKPVDIGREPAADAAASALVWLKARQASLTNWLKSSLRAVVPGANRESSPWRALRAEYGPDEPTTRAAWSDTSSVRSLPYAGYDRSRP
jgi:hypothetical protein